jgi:hypothetical protein
MRRFHVIVILFAAATSLFVELDPGMLIMAAPSPRRATSCGKRALGDAAKLTAKDARWRRTGF